VGAGPRARVRPVGPFAVELGALLTTPIIAHDFVIVGQEGIAHEPATIGVFAFLGVGLELP
jgi:hypothetical protein